MMVVVLTASAPTMAMVMTMNDIHEDGDAEDGENDDDSCANGKMMMKKMIISISILTLSFTITADLGDQKKLRAVDISWEFPAKSFTVAVSTDGVKWSEVFATDTNVLSSVSIQLGSISASRVRVVMHEVRFLVLCCCFAAWLALVAGISVLSRSCSVWH